MSGIADLCGEQDRIIDITVAIDKLDKIGEDGVVKELKDKGFSEETLEIIRPMFQLSGTNDEVIAQLTEILQSSEIGLKGIEELKYVLAKVNRLGVKKAKIKVDVTLARRIELLHRCNFRSKGQWRENGKHLRWWTLRRSYRIVWFEKHVRRWNFFPEQIEFTM